MLGLFHHDFPKTTLFHTMIIGKRIKYAKVTNSKSSIKVPATNAVVKSKIIVIIAGGRFVLSDKNLINFVNNTFILIS